MSNYRIFCELDTFLKMLLDKFKVTVNSSSRDMRYDVVQSASVPYTDQGDLSADNVGGNVSMTLDLRPGQRIVTREGREGRVLGYCPTQTAWTLLIQEQRLLLGWWWLDQATRAELHTLPVWNRRPGGKCH